jgi:hypothetical protein
MNFKIIFKNFAIKQKYREKSNKCKVVGLLDKFYQNIILQQKEVLQQILTGDQKFSNLEFLLRAYNINTRIFKDDYLHQEISKQIYNTEYLNDRNKNKSTVYNLYKTLAEGYQHDPSSSLAKDLVRNIIQKSYLFSSEEFAELLALLNMSEEDAKEIEDYVVQQDDKYLTKLTLKNDSVAIRLSKYKTKASIYSKQFNKKIVLVALDDLTDNVLKSFDIVNKEKPNIIIFQKRPIFNLQGSEKYIGIFDKERLIAYHKEILSNEKLFHVNTVERLVYQNRGNLKSVSYVQSLIWKCYHGLSLNYNLKVIFSDLPVSREVEHVVRNVFTDNEAVKAFFTSFKLNYLFEKYLWLTEDIDKKCPACSSEKPQFAHSTTEMLMEEYLLALEDGVRVTNIADKIVQAANTFKNEPVILSFVDKKYLYAVLERVTKELVHQSDNEGSTSDYKNLFDYEKTNMMLVYDNSNKIEFLNKLAIANNIYSNVRYVIY